MIFSYFATMIQLPHSICMSELTNTLLGLLVVQIRRKSGHIEKLDILRNWSATAVLLYSFTISYGGLVAYPYMYETKRVFKKNCVHSSYDSRTTPTCK